MKLEERVQEIDELMVNGEIRKALKKLSALLHTKKADLLDNPYLHLRKGQCHYFLNEKEEAAKELLTAYALDGERIFEDEDPEFRNFLRERQGE